MIRCLAGFANEAQFLLINAESVREVSRRVAAKGGSDAEQPLTDAELQVRAQSEVDNVVFKLGQQHTEMSLSR